MASDDIDVSVCIITYNGMDVLSDCIDSILQQSHTPSRVMLVDNASTDGTPQWVAETYPDIKLIASTENNGPNPARNIGLKESHSKLALLVDDDAVLDERCLEELIAAYQKYPEAGVWAPRVVYHGTDVIQYGGFSIHFLCEAIIRDEDTPIATASIRDIEKVGSAPGVCLLIDTDKAAAIGFFDEDFFFSRTDSEFILRLAQAGYPTLFVPDAICGHKVKKRGLTKAYFQVRNRWYMILKTYAWKTLILLSPALLLYEIIVMGFLTLKGYFPDYVRGIKDVIKALPELLKKREFVQPLRKVNDKELITSGEMHFRKELLKNPIANIFKKAVNLFFDTYWRIVVPFV